MDVAKLEAYYERDILPHYGIHAPGIVWVNHASIATDVVAHYFTYNSETYVLIFEDFPSTSHYVAEDNELIVTKDGERSIDTRSEDYVENMTGFFTLYKELSQ